MGTGVSSVRLGRSGVQRACAALIHSVGITCQGLTIFAASKLPLSSERSGSGKALIVSPYPVLASIGLSASPAR